MRRVVIALVALISLTGPSSSQTSGTVPTAFAGASAAPSLPGTLIALPALPLPTGARVEGFGDSFTQFNAFSIGTLAVGQSASGVIEAALAADPRFNFDYWYDPASPWAGAGQGIQWSGANQGIAGDHLVDGRVGNGFGILNRTAYALSRNPQILILNAGTNSINSGDPASADPGATGGAGNGASAAYVTGKLDAIISNATQRGIWVVLSTLYPRADWPVGDLRHQVIRDVNTWVRAQAGRSGVKILDPYDALVSSTGPDGINTSLFSSDNVHPGPAGAYVIGVQYLLPVLQSMIAAGTIFSTDVTLANYLASSIAQMNGTTGTLQNGATGTVPTGYVVNRTRGTSGVAASIEAAGTYNRIVLAVNPLNDALGTAYHQADIQFPPVIAPAGLAAGDWIQMYLHVEANDAASFSVARMTASVGQGSTARVAQIAMNESSVQFSTSYPGRGGYWIVTKPMQIPPGAIFDRIGGTILSIYWPKTMSSSFTAKIDRPIYRKIADPRPPWGL
ncbi:MAG: hydrolase family protein [Sphingomonadales bacterium]|nr:hydrolase family protein [Sphingomonadales bacterium]